MSDPLGPIVGAVNLNDGLHTRFAWSEEEGLSSPASRSSGASLETFAGPYRVAPAPWVYDARSISLRGYFAGYDGLAEGYGRLARLYALAGSAGVASVLQVGALGLPVYVKAPSTNRIRAHSRAFDYSLQTEATEPAWSLLAGSLEGTAYGLSVNGDTLNHTAGGAARVLDVFALEAGPTPTVTNLGTAPAPLVLAVSGTSSSFFIRCTAPGYTRRIQVTPVLGVATVLEEDGLFVPPGVSVLRYETSAGALIAGTIASSIYGTRWRFEGLDNAYSTDNSLVVYSSHMTRAYYANAAFTTSSGLRSAHPDQPRFGNPGTYNASNAGIVIEPDRTNIALNSQDLTGANWTVSGTVTRTANYSTAPDGSTTSTRLVWTAGATGAVTQAVTYTAAPYIVSFYARGTGSFQFQTYTGVYTVTPGANWTRYEYRLVPIAGAYFLTFTDNALAACDVQIWGVQLELATGQPTAQASSYIPTTTVSQRRYQDILGVRPLENLLAWSNRFDKRSTTSTDRGIWYLAGGTLSAGPALIAGPSGVLDAQTLTAVGAQPGLQQRLLNAENLANKTIAFSVWLKNSVSTPDSDAFLQIEEYGAGGALAGNTSHGPANLTDEWRRWTVQRKLSSPVTDVSLQIRASGNITYYFAHAHAYVVSEGANNVVTAGSTSVSAPYVETQGEPVYRDNAWVWPAWLTQNGYIEADVCFVETANPDSRTTIILGATSGIYTPSLEAGAIYRGSGDATASNIIRYTKGYVGGTTLSSYTPASTLFDGAYHKFRLEWVNFTINGARTMNLRLYIDGTQVSFVTSAGTSWATPPVLFPLHAGASTSFQTMKNIVIGVPSIPANAVPEPY